MMNKVYSAAGWVVANPMRVRFIVATVVLALVVAAAVIPGTAALADGLAGTGGH